MGLGSSHTTPCGAAVPARPPTLWRLYDSRLIKPIARRIVKMGYPVAVRVGLSTSTQTKHTDGLSGPNHSGHPIQPVSSDILKIRAPISSELGIGLEKQSDEYWGFWNSRNSTL
jgi:hypothetical protein